MRLLGFIILIICTCSCGSKGEIEQVKDASGDYDTLTNDYGKTFQILQRGSDYKILLQQGVNTNNYFEYTLTTDTTLEGNNIIYLPLNKVYVTATPVIGFLEALGELDKISGISESIRIYNKHICDKLDQGSILEVGSISNLNIEKVVVDHPELIIISDLNYTSPSIEKVTRAGINVFSTSFWLEEHPLGRLEWIKVFGVLFGKYDKACDYYDDVKKDYLQLIDSIKYFQQQPKILMNKSWKDNWYMPGGDSYMTKYIAHAGGDYYHKNVPGTNSVQLSFEEVALHYLNADVWLNPGSPSKMVLEKIDSRYSRFKPFRTGRIYDGSKNVNKNGANDYWESGITHPHLILKDLIYIFHTDSVLSGQLNYFRKIE